MTRRLQIPLAVLFCLFAMGGTMFAHHGSAAGYDYTYRITTKATVTNLVWSNPHGQLYFDMKNDKGEVQNWAVELNSPGNLIRNGWTKTKDTFKAGDQILVTFVPAKDDRHFGICGDFVAADGTQYHNRQGCGVSDVSKLQVKPGYAAVEVKFPEDAKGPQGQEQ